MENGKNGTNISAIIIIFFIALTIWLAGCSTKFTPIEEEIVIPPGEFRGVHWEKSQNNISIKFQIWSDVPVDVYVVPTDSDRTFLLLGESFYYFPTLSKNSVYHFSGSGVIPSTSHLVIINRGNEIAHVKVEVESEETSENALSPFPKLR